jgi:histidinol-phosphate phosphatase family protein
VHRVTRPAIFLDRDGVLVENRADYIRAWREVEFIPDAFDAMRRLGASDYVIVIVTNQSAVGRGLISIDEALSINHRISTEVVERGGRVDASYLCPHVPEDKCFCRKPAPGMLLRAATELNLDLSHSYLIGDAITDLEAAEAVGVRGILVRTGRGNEQATLLRTDSSVVVGSLADAATNILGQGEPEH